MEYDIIVVGGGHAGCEAAYCCNKQGFKTALITSNIKNIADMACNPSIGGTAKGIVVREIDALGGIMGKIADKSHIQIKMLNSGKGSAVHSLRTQADKVTYSKNMYEFLCAQVNIDLVEDTVEELVIEKNKLKGIKTESGEIINSKIVILTTGTYLKSTILIGDIKKDEGPHGEKRSNFLSDNLSEIGFEIQRLKTGTPPRLSKESIDFSAFKEEKGDQNHLYFSFDDNVPYDIGKQVSCYLGYTNDETKRIINENLEKSSMYGGHVTGIGPTYCPSIEDKIVRFSEKERHQLFLEPESLYYDSIYLAGISTSMPENIQEQIVHSIKGLENAKILKYAYAIEYDAINSLQLTPTLETKIVENLFTAGQINGTSGYEEAACQGLVAGINACAKLQNKEPLIIKRNEAYIGVLIDDLITKGTTEPYRLLTSRAEFRLLLRNDNADLRLRKKGYEHGLISENQYQKLLKKEIDIDKLINLLQKTKSLVNDETYNIKKGTTLYEMLKRPEINIEYIASLFLELNEFDIDVLNEVQTNVKYEGYIKKSLLEAEKLKKLEDKQIPIDLDYNKVHNLATEARQKLTKIKPQSLGQATRISGVNPVDISVLSIYLKKEYNHE